MLITGCSSGIGRATARHLAGRGWPVYATARALPDLAGLREAGCRLLPLDVTDEESRRRAVAAVEAEAGAVGVLVNNAGYSQSGAFETVPLDRVRRQFETNVFGLVRLTQLVLPGMRRQRWGKVVNLSSMGGRLTFPGGAYYHATKHAVEALTDALRFEVAGFGVDAILIEPGLIRSRFGATAAALMAQSGSAGAERGGGGEATPTGPSTRPWPGSPRTRTAAGSWPAWGPARRPSPPPSSAPSAPGAPGPATAPTRPDGCCSPCGPCSRTPCGTASWG